MDFYTKYAAEVLSHLSSSADGLDESVAKERFEKYGANKLK